jgi:hypothetical protein
METGYQSWYYTLQKFQKQSSSHRAIAINPQPRKLNHTIITDTISVARRPIATFLPVCADDNRDLIAGLSDFTNRGRLFIRCYRCSTGNE